jgi:ribonuclease BN (tRNA processing enzyme)
MTMLPITRKLPLTARLMKPACMCACAALLAVTTSGCFDESSAQTPTPTATPSASATTTGTVLTLLGVAPGPIATAQGAGIATLLTVNGKNYLFDSGVGTSQQLAKLKLMPKDISNVFLTHLHDDHTADLPSWLSFANTGRIGLPEGGSTQTSPRIGMYGPPPIEEYIAGLDRLLNVSGAIRSAEAGQTLKPASDMFDVNTVTAPSEFFRDDNIRVSAIRNTHYTGRGVTAPGGSLSYSYRIEAPGKVIVLTGDTSASPDLPGFARGADILVAEMVSDDASGLPAGLTVAVAQEGHLSPRQVGELAAAAGVKKVVLSHYTKATDADLRTIASIFRGEVVVGRDLMTF